MHEMISTHAQELPMNDHGAERARAQFAAHIAVAQQVMNEQMPTLARMADLLIACYRQSKRCCFAATVAVPMTRSTWPPNWSGAT